MFTDYLYQTVNDNLLTDTNLFPDLSSEQVEKAISYIKSSQPLPTDGIEIILARFLFAKTIKYLLENPKSDLSIELTDNYGLRKNLQQVYLYSIKMINDHFGHQLIAPMPGPFVVPDLGNVVGILQKEIARGTYGKVYMTTRGYAVKTFFREALDSSTMRETSILRYLDHPNVINLVAMQLEPPQIAMPLASGTLRDIDTYRPGRKEERKEERKWYFYQIFRGLAYCHSKHVWHRDLKPENVLLFDDSALARYGQIAKIADFGLAIPYARQGNNSTKVVTIWWRAPELLLGDTDYSGAVDVWSLGLMLMDAILGSSPLAASDTLGMMENIFRLLGTPTETDWPGITTLPDWDKMSYFRKFSNTLDASIQADPDELEVIKNTVTWPNRRMSALDVLKLPYFDSVRDMIETQIPAAPITVQPCGQMMLNEQQKIIKQNWFVEDHRKKLYEWLWEVKAMVKLTEQTFFMAIFLMDLIIRHTPIEKSKLKKYASAA